MWRQVAVFMPSAVCCAEARSLCLAVPTGGLCNGRGGCAEWHGWQLLCQLHHVCACKLPAHEVSCLPSPLLRKEILASFTWLGDE